MNDDVPTWSALWELAQREHCPDHAKWHDSQRHPYPCHACRHPDPNIYNDLRVRLDESRQERERLEQRLAEVAKRLQDRA